jgi:DNA-directed RNA polymerase specialized sigma24 family protein
MVDATLTGNTTTAELQARLDRPEAQSGTLTLVMLLIEDEKVTEQFEVAGLTVREQAAIVLQRRGLLGWEIARLMDTTEANALQLTSRGRRKLAGLSQAAS